MADKPIKVNMTPSHPGEFVRKEIVEPLGLSISSAADVETMLRMQAWYDAAQMRARAGEVQVQRYEPA